MIDVVEQLKSRVSMLKEVVDKQTKLEGARDQILLQLKDMGMDSIEAARIEAKALQTQLQEITDASLKTIASMDALIKR